MESQVSSTVSFWQFPSHAIHFQLQEQLQAQQNPLAEAEQIKAQAFLTKAQATQDLDIAKLKSDNAQFVAKLESDNKKASEDLALKLTDLELKYNKDLNAQLTDNTNITQGSIEWLK